MPVEMHAPHAHGQQHCVGRPMREGAAPRGGCARHHDLVGVLRSSLHGRRWTAWAARCVCAGCQILVFDSQPHAWLPRQ